MLALPAGTPVWIRPITSPTRNNCRKILREVVYLDRIIHDPLVTKFGLHTFPEPIEGYTGFNYEVEHVIDVLPAPENLDLSALLQKLHHDLKQKIADADAYAEYD